MTKANSRTRHWLDTTIGNHLRDKQNARTRSSIGKYFYPSSCHEEARMLYLIFIGRDSREFSDASLEKMDHGNYVHEKLYDYFEGSKILISKEQPKRISYPVPLSCRIDSVVMDPQGNKYLVDVKSMDGGLFKDLKEPKLGDITQWGIYSVVYDIHVGCLFYENKNTQRKKIFDLVYSAENDVLTVKYGAKTRLEWKDFWKNLVKKLKYVLAAYNSSRVPERCVDCKSNCRNWGMCIELEKEMEVMKLPI